VLPAAQIKFPGDDTNMKMEVAVHTGDRMCKRSTNIKKVHEEHLTCRDRQQLCIAQHKWQQEGANDTMCIPAAPALLLVACCAAVLLLGSGQWS
jgi:hypothetical protein